MKSRISSCKRFAFRKDCGRFWPVWVGYLLCLEMVQILQSNEDLNYWYAANMGDSISLMGIVNLFYGFVVAMTLFGDLFNSRMCNGLHALPLKREHWFAAHIRAGLLFSVIPTILIMLFSEVVIYRYCSMEDAWQIPLLWFAATNLQYLFFFGLAVFCALCVGSRFAMVVVYGLVNFFSILVYLLVDQLYVPLLKGVTTMSGPFEMLCPVWQIAGSPCIDVERQETGRTYLDEFGIAQREVVDQFHIVPDGLIYVGILAVVGIALLLIARRMYQKRHLESAGDFLAVRWLEPVFQVVFTVLCAAALQGIFVTFNIQSGADYVLPAMGLLVGWFGSRMLLERTTKVFRLKNIAGFLLLTAVMAGSLFATHLDPLGIATWVPKVGETRNATIRMNYRRGYTTEIPAEIADITRLHELALEQEIVVHPDYNDMVYNPTNSDPDAVQIMLQYTNQMGWLSQRNYYILAEGEGAELLKKYTSRLDVLFANEVQDAADLRSELRDLQQVFLDYVLVPSEYITEEFCNALADAIAADCKAGNLVQSGAFHKEPIRRLGDSEEEQYFLMLEIQNEKYWDSFYVYADCENILNLLETSGVWEAVEQEQARFSYYG